MASLTGTAGSEKLGTTSCTVTAGTGKLGTGSCKDKASAGKYTGTGLAWAVRYFYTKV